MTLLVSWAGIQTRGKENNIVGSLYIAADSRYSWPNTNVIFDYGKKIFSCYNSPDAFALCGTVMFPALMLSALTTLIDRGVFFVGNESYEEKVAKVKGYLDNAIHHYNLREIGRFEILYMLRVSEKFHLCHFIYDGNLKCDDIDLLQEKNHYFATGSGKGIFEKYFNNNVKNDNYLTSRYIFHCFIHAINSNQVEDVGGKPQIVALYGTGCTIDIGYIEDSRCYLHGNECADYIYPQKVQEWRNENFERCDPKTKQMLKGAQRQPFRNWKNSQ